MGIDKKSLYESEGSIKSLWNTYKIYDDHIELDFRIFFTKILISKDELVAIDIHKPPVIRTAFWALKLDLADFYTHIAIKRNSGFFKQIRFTPKNPYEFKQIVTQWKVQ